MCKVFTFYLGQTRFWLNGVALKTSEAQGENPVPIIEIGLFYDLWYNSKLLAITVGGITIIWARWDI